MTAPPDKVTCVAPIVLYPVKVGHGEGYQWVALWSEFVGIGKTPELALARLMQAALIVRG